MTPDTNSEQTTEAYDLDVTVCDGKYTVRARNGMDLHALRYGQPWRDLAGDGLVLALATELQTVKADLESMVRAIQLPMHVPISYTELLDERDALRAALHDIHTAAHCIAKAGPLNTPTLQEAWAQFMQIGAMATGGLVRAKGAE